MKHNSYTKPFDLLAYVALRVLSTKSSVDVRTEYQPNKRRKLMSEDFRESIGTCYYPFHIPKRRSPRSCTRPNLEHCIKLQNLITERYTTLRSFEDEVDNENSNVNQRMQLPGPRQENPDMPEVFKNCIEGLGGSEILLVMTKKLFYSDVSDRHCRLLISKKQMKQEFLNEEEERTVMNKGLQVPLIDPSLVDRSVVLREWNMNSKVYALLSGWKDIQKDNELKKDDTVQLWSFRTNSELHFALIKIE